MNFKNRSSSNENENENLKMEKQGKEDKDGLDPLKKLKKERELLIQWSKKLKNNNSSFLNIDKLDIEQHNEKEYSSDNSLNEKKQKKFKINKKKNEEHYYMTESDDNDNGNGDKKNIQIYLNDDHFDKKIYKNNINSMYGNKKKPIKIVRKHNDIRNSVNLKNVDHGNDIEINKTDGQNYIGKFYNENILHKKNEHSFSDSSIEMSENLSEIVDHNNSYENQNINEYKTIDSDNTQINYQNKKKNRIEYSNHDMRNYYENSNNNKIVKNIEANKSDEEYEDNNLRWKENSYRYNIDNYSGDKKEINKKKIKLTKKFENKENASELYNIGRSEKSVKNMKNTEYHKFQSYANISNSSKSDNDKIPQNNNYHHYKSTINSANTYVPIPSIVNLKDNESNTTLYSNNDGSIENYKKNSGTILKNKEGIKFATLLKEKVNLLENKKEILNDRIKDLHDNTYSLMETKEKDNLTIQHYELLIKNLEAKYNKLFNMYQELDEHRISYVDAYKEKQTKIENLSAIMQIKSEENLKLTQEINILTKKNEEMQGQIYEYIKDAEDKEKEFNEKKEEYFKLVNLFEKNKKENDQLKKEIDEKVKEMDEIKKQNKNLKEENEKFKGKQKNITKFNSKINDGAEFYIPKIDNLLCIINKMMQIFKLNEEDIMKYASYLKENSNIIKQKLQNNDNIYDDIINILNANVLDPIVNIVKKRDEEYSEHNKIMQIKFDDEILKMYETNINNVELANEYIEQLRNKITHISIQKDNIKKRTILLSNGQGRLNDKPIIKEIQKMDKGTLIYKCKFHTFTHKPVLIYMKMVNNRFITWSKNVKQKKFKKKNLIDIQDITSIEYGLNSRPVYWLIEKQNKEKLKQNKIKSNEIYNSSYTINPYKSFTIYTKKRAYDFFSSNDNTIATWVVGLGVLSYEYNKNSNIQSMSEFIIKKVQLKLKIYCIKNNITYTKLWKDAINKTQKELL
ncbi:hypothetical protein, variant [Plasmodium yoelii 17X]|uniref:PH domain-containing protein n=1 Tax=Plasmodium yoelii 17X TaxID=1323249 RepID=V7PGN0_PLAYE|nr:hypothetical protein YYC_04387 [Plasmodium yoelii 17X]ETB57503.1 hypothetical protein, variant [Plasmodium yoelii 17X]